MSNITKLKWALFWTVLDFLFVIAMWVWIFFAIQDKDWSKGTFAIGLLLLHKKKNGKNT